MWIRARGYIANYGQTFEASFESFGLAAANHNNYWVQLILEE